MNVRTMIVLLAAVSLSVVETAGAGSAGRTRGAHDITEIDSSMFLPPNEPGIILFSEDATDASVQVHRYGHGTTQAKVGYRTIDGSATSPSDFASAAGELTLAAPEDWAAIPLSITDDLDEPANLEDFTVELTRLSNTVIGKNGTATIKVVDDDGVPRPALVREAYTTIESRRSVTITIVRQGARASNLEVPYWFEGGTATAGQDYVDAPGTIVFDGSKSEYIKQLSIQITADQLAESDEQFTVHVGSLTATITIKDVPPQDQSPPITEFENVQHLRTYGPYRFKNNGVYINVNDLELTSIDTVHLALRRRMTSGRCHWWTGSAWDARSCSSHRWIRVTHRVAYNFYHYMRAPYLKPSVGTNVSYYHAFARSRDSAGNLETRLEAGRNANRFEIKA